MQDYYVRDDGTQVNVFYCDEESCQHREIVIYQPGIDYGLKDVNGWGMIYYQFPDGSREVHKILCPYHYERFEY